MGTVCFSSSHSMCTHAINISVCVCEDAGSGKLVHTYKLPAVRFCFLGYCGERQSSLCKSTHVSKESALRGRSNSSGDRHVDGLPLRLPAGSERRPQSIASAIDRAPWEGGSARQVRPGCVHVGMLQPIALANASEQCADATSRECIHVVFVARGTSPLPLRVVDNVLATTAVPQRFCFHVLAGSSALAAAQAPNFLGHRTNPCVMVYNATDPALACSLSPTGIRWLTHDLLQKKNRHYTVPKLFLFELLAVPNALILDADVVVMADVSALWDMWLAWQDVHPRAVLGYAHEQQPTYARGMETIRTSYLGHGNVSDDVIYGYNGGVALQALGRMRSRDEYRDILSDSRLLPASASALPAFVRSVIEFGDQTFLAYASALHAGAWRELMMPLSCEWNWQMNLWFFFEEGCTKCFTDTTCRRPPALLHANNPYLKANMNSFMLHDREPLKAYHYNMGVLARALEHSRPLLACEKARRCIGGTMVERACNASFLLSNMNPQPAARGVPSG